tara:strand:- start:1423 stop:1599 length:177 start_codon:yes stop_codon:yes gene_type:complete
MKLSILTARPFKNFSNGASKNAETISVMNTLRAGMSHEVDYVLRVSSDEVKIGLTYEF